MRGKRAGGAALFWENCWGRGRGGGFVPAERGRGRKLMGRARPLAWLLGPRSSRPRAAGVRPQAPPAAGGRGETRDVPLRESPVSPWAAAGGAGGEGQAAGGACVVKPPPRRRPRGALALGRWPAPRDPPASWSRVAASTGRGSPFPPQKLFSGLFRWLRPVPQPACRPPPDTPTPASLGVASCGGERYAARDSTPRARSSLPRPPRASAPLRSPVLGGRPEHPPRLAAPPGEGPAGEHRAASPPAEHARARRAAGVLVLRVPLGLARRAPKRVRRGAGDVGGRVVPACPRARLRWAPSPGQASIGTRTSPDSPGHLLRPPYFHTPLYRPVLQPGCLPHPTAW